MDDGGQLSTVLTAGRVVLGLIGGISDDRMQASVTQPDTTYPSCDAGRVVCPARDAGRACQETAWKGTLKTVVQRPSPWLTLRLPPRASTRRRAPSRPRPEEKAS